MPGLELILVFVAGAIVIPALYLGAVLVVKIIGVRDNHRKLYTTTSSVGHRDHSTDISDYPVRIVKTRKGYRIVFYRFNDDGDPMMVKTAILEELDRPPRD